MSFYWQGFFIFRHSSHRLWNACLYEARGLLIIPKSGLFDVMDHWHFPQGCPYIVHAFHGGQEKGSVIKVPTPMSRWWSGVWLSGAGWMARWHFSMANPSEVSSLTGGSYHHASCVRPRIGSKQVIYCTCKNAYVYILYTGLGAYRNGLFNQLNRENLSAMYYLGDCIIVLSLLCSYLNRFVYGYN